MQDKKHRYYIVSALTDTKVDLKGTVHFPLSGPLGSVWFILWMFQRILNSGSFKIPTFGWSFGKESRIPRKGEFSSSIPIFNGGKAKRTPENPFPLLYF